jgi:citrate lyase subunit beta / citryl-CoA lyase
VDVVVATLHQLTPSGSIPELTVEVLIETARGVRDVDVIAAHPRVRSVQLGEPDLSTDLGCRPSADESELLSARSRVIAASAAAGLDPPVGRVSPNFSDLDDFRISSELLRRLGSAGRATIHPDQVIIANAIFSPEPEDVKAALRVLATNDEALSQGEGVVGEDSMMIDATLVRASRRTVALARNLDARGARRL